MEIVASFTIARPVRAAMSANEDLVRSDNQQSDKFANRGVGICNLVDAIYSLQLKLEL